MSDHVLIALFVKCSIIIDKELGLDEKRWKWIKSYKWTENSKSKLIDSLLSENIKNNIIEFEMENFKDNKIGVDAAAQKLIDIFDSISSRSCNSGADCHNNCAKVDTSVKLGMNILMGVYNHFRGVAKKKNNFVMAAILDF